MTDWNKGRRQRRSLWSLYKLLLFGALWIQASIFVKGQGSPPGDDETLLNYYTNLHDRYAAVTDNDKKVHSDCNIDDSIAAGDDKEEHHGWGTLNTLKYLINQTLTNDRKLTYGEKLNDLDKLRVFLARVGYLKVPGTLIFLNKQTETLRLEGCGTSDDVIWRLQGEKEMDKEFHHKGHSLKEQSPNSANYIHKYTCIQLGKCSHTFYVITRLLPELPQGVTLRETKDKNEYLLNCAVPYCNVRLCKKGKTEKDMHKRSYPPYKIWWNVAVNSEIDNKKVFQGKIKEFEKGVIDSSNAGQLDKGDYGKMKVIWDTRIRKAKDLPETKEDSYQKVADDGADWIDAFGDKHTKTTKEGYGFNSRIVIEEAKKEIHNGPYECVIQDGNGVVSTPSTFPGKRDWADYRGKTNIHVIPTWELILIFGCSLACLFLVMIIIFICPKKMEYDDGTRYTKEELVSPAKNVQPAEETEVPQGGEPQGQGGDENPVPAKSSSHHHHHHTKSHTSKKSMKGGDKEHDE